MQNTFVQFFLLTLLYFGVVINACADVQTLPSTITSVTIYPGAAHVTRTLTVDLTPGDHTIVFDKIVVPLDENTLTVSGEGSAAVKIYGGYIKQEFLTASPDERVKELQQKIQDVEDEINEQKSGLTVLAEKRSYLNSIRLYSANQIPKDLATTMPAVDALKNVGNFLSDSLTDIEKQKSQVGMKLRDLNKTLMALQMELGKVQQNSSTVRRNLAVDVGCEKAGRLTLNVSYLVNGASWRPLYDARTDLAKSQVELTSFGVVQQNTGEDWENVDLTLSTAKPGLGGRMPYVSPWVLQVYTPQALNRGSWRMKAGANKDLQSAPMAGSVQYEPYYQASNYAVDGTVEKKVAAKAVYSDVQQKGVSVTFKVPRRVTIKSDGTEDKFPVATQSLKADFQYSSFPKASEFSYLNSDVVNSNGLQLVGGEVNLFLEGDFVGKSTIDNVAPGEKFSLYLGVNENVKVKREQVAKKVDDIVLMGIPSPNRTTSVKMKITLENYDAHPVKYNLFESMPVAENDKQIKVKIIDVSMEPAKKDWEDRKGVWQWVVELAPKEKKEIYYTYVVEHPRDIQVGGI